ncbi:MAG: 3-deoxy-8-phosphooctulonate synthase [Pseudomonadota bacterium]|nr:3-deoxy-8-phosphooctulonate synthase [Pseudomonadota bacterium]
MTKTHQITINNLKIGNDLPLVLIAGPCVMESRNHALDISSSLAEMANDLEIGLIYKTSYDKANRTSSSSSRGLGIDEALKIFSDIKKETGLTVITDVHEPNHCKVIAEVVDVLQIPAFLCRQTDLLVAAGNTGKVINIKKGQFLAPWDMKQVVEKVKNTGNPNVMVCERGASFGYNTLVSDMRSLPIMAQTGCPVVFDATHSVQQPGGKGTSSGGQREFAPVLARSAVSIGIACIFLETHENPDKAPSDGPNMIPLKNLPKIVATLKKFDQLAKKNPIKIE